MISFIRILVIGFLFGNLFSILFSLAGAALSLACMTLAKRYLGLSITGVSIVGGVTHNLGQIVVAALVVENVNLFYYFPALLIAGADHRIPHRDPVRRNLKENIRKETRMIAYIKGTVEEILEDRVILEAGNLGYNIFMPMGAVEHLLHKGQEIKIHTLSECEGRCPSVIWISGQEMT